MTAAERAHAQAVQGAAQHRAETSYWVSDGDRDIVPAQPFRDDPRYNWPNATCPVVSRFAGVICTRTKGHPGRHIATGTERVWAAWPGTHEPTLADLDDPQPATAEPATLVLPTGWERRTGGSRHDVYARFDGGEDGPNVYADTCRIEVGEDGYTPDEARALAARLVEAAGIVEQLRAGAS